MTRSRGNQYQRWGAGKRKLSDDVQLSRYDLSQLDEAFLATLPQEQLRALSARLLADLKAAHERLDQNPSNSSRPPSSQAPWEAEGRDADSGGPADKTATAVAGGTHTEEGQEDGAASARGTEGAPASQRDASAQQRRAG